MLTFDSYIPKLLDSFSNTWNDAKMKKFALFLDQDILVTTPGLVFKNVSIESQVIRGKEEVMKFLEKTRKKMPLRTKISEIIKVEGKRINFKVHYYEIDVMSCFECLLSEYGKIKELTITRLEDAENRKISTISILRNVLTYQLRNLFGK